MRNAAFIFVTSFGVFVLGGCNTMQGLGKDIEKAGEKIEKTAK